MVRHKVSEVVLMVLAVLGGLGILLLIGARLIHVMAGSTTAGSGGVSAVAFGVSAELLAILLFAVVAIILALAVSLWRR